MTRYFIVNKPGDMISQFVSPYKQRLLCDLDYDFPEGTHAIGRLDQQSEGLLILTTDKSLTKKLLHPNLNYSKTYLVQVQREISNETINQLSSGVQIKVKGKGDYFTKPCQIKRTSKPVNLWDTQVPENKYTTVSWLEFTLTEGKNRQIRKMCAKVKHKCNRLIRTKIGNLEIGSLKPGEVKEMQKLEFLRLLSLTED